MNYANGISEAVQHLLLLGHRRIGFISGPLSLKSAAIRRSAFLDCLTKSGIIEDTCLIAEADHTVTGGLEACRDCSRFPIRQPLCSRPTI